MKSFTGVFASLGANFLKFLILPKDKLKRNVGVSVCVCVSPSDPFNYWLILAVQFCKEPHTIYCVPASVVFASSPLPPSIRCEMAAKFASASLVHAVIATIPSCVSFVIVCRWHFNHFPLSLGQNCHNFDRRLLLKATLLGGSSKRTQLDSTEKVCPATT